MLNLNEQYITNAAGERIGVILDLESWEKLIEELEELDDLRAFDEAMAAGVKDEEIIPLEQAVDEIEKSRS